MLNGDGKNWLKYLKFDGKNWSKMLLINVKNRWVINWPKNSEKMIKNGGV
jgi:hypothetical protein